ncbi:transmembrane protein 272-like isoform X1 [Mytilus galloprovincialis]|uniref:transmembrane protein 272-like isoform X1 n=1 Tax=Mytilus galloprovincialis TaxID=29158 RepID=UPI003F7C6239
MSLLDESPPPSYDSIYGQLKEARHTTDGNVSFAKRGFTIILGSTICTILLVLFLSIPIACIVIGSLYLHDCPAQRLIPIYLIVAGAFSLVKDLSSLLQKCKAKRTEEEQEGGAPTNFFDGLVGCFLFAWFICGNVWIYSTHNHFSTDSTKADFCEPVLFYFSFWLLNATYILIGISCLLCCCGVSFACCAKDD